MNDVFEKFDSSDERTERLICRLLDRQLSAADRAELDEILARDASARTLLAEYQRNDALCAAALRSDVAASRPARILRRPGLSFWIASAGAVLAAAAVLVFALLADQIRSPGRRSPAAPVAWPRTAGTALPGAAQLIDYRPQAPQPPLRQSRLWQDVIGIRGDDENVIYVFERNTRTTRVRPLSGEF